MLTNHLLILGIGDLQIIKHILLDVLNMVNEFINICASMCMVRYRGTIKKDENKMAIHYLKR